MTVHINLDPAKMAQPTESLADIMMRARCDVLEAELLAGLRELLPSWAVWPAYRLILWFA